MTEAGTVHMTLNYRAAADCGKARIKLLRWNPAVSGSLQIVLEQGVGMTLAAVSLPAGTFASGTGVGSYLRGVGSTSVDIDLSHLDNGTVAFGFSFSCSRPFHPVVAGGDLLIFAVSIPAVSVPIPSVTHTVGGTVSGLAGTGLVLQNGAGNHLAVAEAGAFTFVTPVAIANSVFGPYSIAVDPTGRFAYAVSNSGASVAAFSINANTGVLSVVGYTNTGASPNSVAVHPNGHYVYVANVGSSTITVFSIDLGTGALTGVGAPVPTGSSPHALTIDAMGATLYVANLGDNSSSAFSIDAVSGALTSLGAATATGSQPIGFAVTPRGQPH
ncbi:MAG: beta-propeller fold lactonase family protein [Rhodoferax sp.]|nr:beta-propeller fold lactonase family protein [Rhodoferax sp.]